MKLRRIIAVLLSVCLITCVSFVGSTVQADAHPDLPAGDVNADGVVNIRDVTQIQRILADMVQPDDQTRQVAKTDFSRDDLFIGDATNIQRFLAEYDDQGTREVGKAAFIWRSNKYGYVPALQEYQRYLEQNLANFEFSGVAYVTRNGRVLCQTAVGKANTPENVDMTLDTLFPVGSVSKQFCATAVLMLQEQGRLSVSDTLGKYFPEYEIGSGITLHQLLCMRSGIRDLLNSDDRYEGHEDPFMEFSLSEDNSDEENTRIMLDWLFGEELAFTPGTEYSYSNSNYVLLSLIVEQVSGVKYADFLKQNIFTPLGMTSSGVYPEMKDDPALAESTFNSDNPYYAGIDFSLLPYSFWWECDHVVGAGDIVSCAADMDKWMNSLRDGTLLSEESLTAMTTVYTPSEAYGYGIGNTSGILYHLGRIYSYQTGEMTVPADNLNVFIVTNNDAAAMAKNVDLVSVAYRIVSKIR